jgi:hypothetical protein
LAANEGWILHHLDVKSAFLHGDLKEEVYVRQPEGFEKPGEEGKVCKLSKALYGLKQASRAWNIKLDSYLKELKFQQCLHEQVVYQKKVDGNLVIVGIYVADIVVTGSRSKDIDDFKRHMATKFEMSDLGKLQYYLGIEVEKTNTGISINKKPMRRDYC